MFRLLFILLITSATSYCQQSDLIILKKKSKTINSYYPGTQIQFITNTGAYRDAVITDIHHDSLFLREYIIRTAVTQLGYYITDTLGSYRYAYHYKDIKNIGKKENKGFNMRGSGAALFGGGILLTLANGVVYLADRKRFSPAFMGASAGLAAIGYVLAKSGSKGMIIGKKHYKLEYINLSAEKK